MKSKIRELQDKVANYGWRIEHISHATDGEPEIIGFENWAGYVAMVSMMGFPIGCGMAIYSKTQGQDPLQGCIIAIASLLVALGALGIKNRLKKEDWIFTHAKCSDREVRKFITAKGTGPTWACRILCEFEYDGSLIQCTPTVHWKSFRSESDAHQFLTSRIDQNGGCTLKVNPKRPKEANLVERITHLE